MAAPPCRFGLRLLAAGALGGEGRAAGGPGAENARPRFSAACCRSAWVTPCCPRKAAGISSSSEESSSIASSVAETSHFPLSATRTSVTLGSVASSTDCAKASRRIWCSGAGRSQMGQHQACFGGMLRMVCT